MPKKKQKSKEADEPVQLSLFDQPEYAEIQTPEFTRQTVKSREAQIRADADIYTDTPVIPTFPPLIFPYRWERLKAEAKKKQVLLKPLIRPVQDAIAEVEKSLQRIQETGMGKLLVICGVTGSGKTTFINSLELFIDDIGVHNMMIKTIDTRESVENALGVIEKEKDQNSVIVLEGKEAPGSFNSDEIDILLTTLNADFRSDSGCKTLFVIPTISQAVAQSISERAAKIGGMTSKNKPFYVFNGPPRNDYISIANDTLRALNESRTLLEYGISDKMARGIAQAAESIGAFMESCYEEIQKERDLLRNLVAVNSIKRKRIHLWMVFCSLEEDTRRNYDIIRSLTFGDFQYVQMSRMLTGDSEEVRYWENKQDAFARAAEYLDLRLMYLPLRTANAVVTAYGHDELIKDLKKLELMQRQATRERAQQSIASTAIGAFLRREGFVDRDISKRGKPDATQQKLFMYILNLATKDDKMLNAFMADALRNLHKTPEDKITTELPLNDVKTLITDIAVVSPTDIYCLEVKWRSSVLYEGEVIRQTAGRVREFAENLPELKKLLDRLN